MSSKQLVTAALLLLVACAPKPPSFNPDDPAEIAAVEEVMKASLDGAAAADADRVLAVAEGAPEFTFITGDVLLTGLEDIKEDFRATYAGVAHQDHRIGTKRVRLLTPDVALYTVVGEGTYTDEAGWTSSPVGLGLTVVLVKRDGRWQAQHVHQSVAF